MDLDELFAGPIGEVPAPEGTLYVYSPSADVLRAYKELADLSPDHRGAWLLPKVASLVRRVRLSDGIQPLPADVLSELADASVAAVGEVLRTATPRVRLEGEEDAPRISPRKSDETSRAFLARVIDAQIAADRAKMKETYDKAMGTLGSSFPKLFQDLERSSENLGGSLRALDQLNDPSHYVNPMQEEWQRIAQERREDRERARLASQATADSVRMLQHLATVAERVMLRLAAQDKKLDKQTRVQLWVTVISVVASLAVSIVGAVYAIRSYEHDLVKDAVDDGAVRAAAAREERATQALEQNAALLQQNSALLEEVKALRAFQPSAVPASGTVRP